MGKIFDYMRMKYINRTDKDNIFPVGVTDAEFRQFCIEYLLGEDWYVVDPLGQNQINEIALDEILAKHSRRYMKEYKNHKSRKQMKMVKIFFIVWSRMAK